MNGATPEDDANTNKRPKRIKTVTMGMSHHIFRAHKNCRISPMMPVLVTMPLKKFDICYLAWILLG